MKFSYHLKRICGSVYSNGEVAFTPDGNSIVSPIGNRLNIYDLVNQSTDALQMENRKNIMLVAISHNGRFLVSVDLDGNALFFNYPRKVLLHKFNFRQRVHQIKFSPDDKHFAVTFGRGCQVWRTPNAFKEFAPLSLIRTFMGHYDESNCLDWTADSSTIIIGSKDLTARIYANIFSNSVTLSVLTGHRDEIIGSYFHRSGTQVFTVATDGGLFTWNREEASGEEMVVDDSDEDTHKKDDKESDSDSDDEEEQDPDQVYADEIARRAKKATKVVQRARSQWQLTDRQLLRDHQGDVVCTSYSRTNSILALGFSSGVFGLYEMPGCTNLQRLSVSNSMINSIALNSTGEWLALGVADKGQLLVWEWKSESYVLKQQGHLYGLNSMDFSPEGQYIATGGEDGRVKIWNTLSGFCVITFKEHIAPVTGVKFIGQGQGKALLSASLDGTVRAHDLLRYKNFKTLTTPTPVQFTCLAADPSGEVVCAGSLDPFNIYVWALQTGKLLEILAGHEGPIACMSFSAQSGQLASGSWDGTLKLWDVYKNSCIETFEHGCDIMAIAFRPDGKEIACSATNGLIYFWDVESGEQVSSIEGRRDISGGRLTTDATTAENAAHSKFFTALDYSADGTCILAGGRSKYLCIYAVSSGVLVKKFQLSHNRSLEGVSDKLRSDRVVDGVLLDNLQAGHDEDDLQLQRFDNEVQRVGGKALPGAQHSKLNDGSRTTKAELMTSAIQFSPTGREWAAASTQGLQIFALDEALLFAPIELDESVTPQTIALAVANHDYARALTMALLFNERPALHQVVEAVPRDAIDLVVKSLNPSLLQSLMKYLAHALSESKRLEFYLRWVLALLQVHGPYIQSARNNMTVTEGLRSLLRVLQQHEKEVLKMTEDNVFLLSFVASQMSPDQDRLVELRTQEEEALTQVHAEDEDEDEAAVLDDDDDEGEDHDEDMDGVLMPIDEDEEEEDEDMNGGWMKSLRSAWQDDDEDENFDDVELLQDEDDEEEEEEEVVQVSSKKAKKATMSKAASSSKSSVEEDREKKTEDKATKSNGSQKKGAKSKADTTPISTLKNNNHSKDKKKEVAVEESHAPKSHKKARK